MDDDDVEEDEDEGDNAEDEVDDDDDDEEEDDDDDVEDDIFEEEDGAQDREPHFARACAVEMHLDMSQEPFYAKNYRQKVRTKAATSVLCGPAQSKCTWTCDKSKFMQKFTG